MDNKEPFWKPALQIFMDVSTWILVPIILALVFGKMLDTHFGTKPFIFLGLTGVAFIISCFGIVKVMKAYMKKIK